MHKQIKVLSLSLSLLIYVLCGQDLQAAKHSLDDFTDTYKIQLSQLHRVQQRISRHIEDSRQAKDSTHEAVQATKAQQAQMVHHIADKIAQVEARVRSLTEQLLSDDAHTDEARAAAVGAEMAVKRDYLRGLHEFRAGLTKLRQAAEAKMAHLELVVTHLIEQRAAATLEVRELKEAAVRQLRDIREDHLKPNLQSISDAYDDQYDQLHKGAAVEDEEDHEVDMDEEDMNQVALPAVHEYERYTTVIGLVQARDKHMKRMYKRIHDLESRALTRSSTAYLQSLTEVHELQLIFASRKLKYFFNAFVAAANEVLNDCILLVSWTCCLMCSPPC